jgi:NADH-quinone oxidoreductase subunit F
VLERFEEGAGTAAEMDTLVDICGQIAGRSFCALGEAAATPYPSALKFFREEFEAATHTPVDDLFDPTASYVFTAAGAR